MRNRRALFLLASALLAPAVVACSDDGGGSATPPATTPDGGGPPDFVDTCPPGPVTVDFRFEGVPAGVTPEVTLTSARETRRVQGPSVVELPESQYTIVATDIVLSDPIARTVLRAPAGGFKFCSGDKRTETITYAPVPSSGKVWTSNANGSAYVLGYASSSLASTSTQPATVVAKTQGGGGIAFDHEGNLWAVGATTTDPTLVRYPAASLGASGDKTPDRKIEVKGTGCSPAARAIAFDPNGDLWLSVLCEKKVVRLARADLTTDGEKTPAASASGLTAPKGIAFDEGGNLWVADEAVRRFDAAALATSPTTPSASLTVPDADSEALAFDRNGDLWSVGGSQTNLARIAKADLAAPGTRDVVPAVAISLGVGALPNGIAFDESGGLWVATSAGKFARLAEAQLATPSTYAAPTVPERVITSSDIGSAGSLAIYPAPANLPLHHRLP